MAAVLATALPFRPFRTAKNHDFVASARLASLPAAAAGLRLAGPADSRPRRFACRWATDRATGRLLCQWDADPESRRPILHLKLVQA